jgi:hypothetical protein
MGGVMSKVDNITDAALEALQGRCDRACEAASELTEALRKVRAQRDEAVDMRIGKELLATAYRKSLKEITKKIMDGGTVGDVLEIAENILEEGKGI